MYHSNGLHLCNHRRPGGGSQPLLRAYGPSVPEDDEALFILVILLVFLAFAIAIR